MTWAIVAAACGTLQQPPQGGDFRPVPLATESGAPAATTFMSGAEPAGAPRKIALLLPLSGAQRLVAEAVRDGFIAAYLADNASAPQPEIIVLDEERPGATAAYRAAISAGVNLVVGPLLKESVTQVAAAAGDVPTVTLNYLDAGTPAPANFYQFSLAPEDEARQVAERAAGEGRLRALVLAPDTDWGRRMLTAFTPVLESLGGTVLAYRFYDPGATDFTAQIQRLLLLDESRARHRQLAANLGVSLEFEPRRRDDVDFIFLAANVASGRLIRPQLRFLYAGDIPTYATSAIFQAGSGGDPDLDGVMFVDAPVLLAPDDRAQSMKAALASRWPAGATGRMRLFALGFDAYVLTSANMRPDSISAITGLSGMLSLDAGGRLHRQMPWAEFRDGRIAAARSGRDPGTGAGIAPAVKPGPRGPASTTRTGALAEAAAQRFLEQRGLRLARGTIGAAVVRLIW